MQRRSQWSAFYDAKAMQLPILFDFDNIPDAKYRVDPQLLVRTVHQIAEPELRNLYTGVRARFYGGWYDERNLTREAQDLVLALGTPPNFIMLLQGRKAVVDLELAYGPQAMPTVTFPHTLRLKTRMSEIRCKSSIELNCVTVRWSPKVRQSGSLNPERKKRSPCQRSDVSTVPI
jgi:hypothetical protein